MALRRAIRWCTLALVLVGACASALPAQAAFPGTNGKIAFSSDSAGNQEVHAMDSDGLGATNLTNNAAFDDLPQYSPNGQKIVFGGNRDAADNFDIYSMDAGGTGTLRLTTHAAFDFWPTYSPDGEKIAFVSDRDNGIVEIYVMNANGTNQTRLTSNSAADIAPAFSPDGQKIAFMSDRDGNYEIYIMDANGSNQNRLTTNGTGNHDSDPAFSPDGQKIAFSRMGDIFVMNPDGSSQTNITNTATGAAEFTPAFSPDGQKIAFTKAGDIHVMNANGTGATNISNSASTETGPNWQALNAVAISSGPSGSTSQTTATFEFAFVGGTPPPGGFECRIDDASFASCASPKTLTNVSDGTHRFQVRYKPDGESAGTAAERSWTVDTTPPNVTIDEAPTGDGNPPDATIRFRADESNVAFVCTVDNRPPVDCSSPHEVRGLEGGLHEFEVVGVDAVGNFSTPARASWQVSGVSAAPPVAVECPPGGTPSVSFGVIVALARSADGCFVREAVSGGDAFVSRGPVSVNGLLLTPSFGTQIIVDSTLSGGLLKATGRVAVQPGNIPLGWTLDDGFTFDALAQGQLAAIQKALAFQDGALELAGMPLPGGMTVEFSADNGGQTKLTPRVSLPRASFQGLPGISPEAQGLTVEVPITASNDLGVTGGIRLKLGEARLFGRVKVKDLDLFYDHTTRSFEGSAGLKLSENTPAGRAEPTFTVAMGLGPDGALGIFKKLSFQLSSVNRHVGYGVFVQRFGASLERATTGGNELARFVSSAGVSLGPRVRLGSFETEIVSVDGTGTLDIPTGAQPPELFSYTIAGTFKVFDVPFHNATVRYVPPSRVELAGRFDQSLFGYGFVGDLATDAQGNPLSWVSPEGLNIEVRGTASFGVLGSPDPADGVFSTTGYAVCAGPPGERAGFGKIWNGEFRTFASTCDLGPYRGGAQPAQAEGARTTEIPAGARMALLSANGDGAPPKVAVDGPGGERIETPAGPEELDDARARIVQDPETNITHVVLRRPAAGRWTVTPLPGSPAMTDLDVADALPPVRVRARVTGKGRRRVLRWRSGPMPDGQRLTFSERGPQTANVLGSSSRRRGRLRFTPDPAPGRRRTIEVTATLDGLPRLTRQVARYTAPPPPRLRRVKGLRLRGRTLAWRRQRAAAEYALMVTLPGGATTSHSTTRPRLRLPARPRRGRVKVTILALDAQQRVGPKKTKRLRARAR